MRIAEVVAKFPPYFGGIGNSCLQYSLGLAELGHRVEVYTSGYGDDGRDDLSGLTVHRLKHQFQVGHAPLLLGLLTIRDVDVIHLHYPFYFGAELIYFVSKLRGIPYVLTYHTDLVGKGLYGYVFRIHKKIVRRCILEGASAIFVTSIDFSEHSELCEIESIQDRIVEVPLGVDTRRFVPMERSERVREILGIEQDGMVVMCVGQLDRQHYYKGIPVLLSAFARLECPGAKLVIIGDGDLRESFEREARDLGIADAVVFAGRVDDDLLNDYLSVSDLVVQPSTDRSEAFGMALLEAQAAGRAVIASDLPGVRSHIRDGVDGLLSVPNDPTDLAKKIAFLLRDRALLESFGARGRENSLSYSWEKVCLMLSGCLARIPSPRGSLPLKPRP